MRRKGRRTASRGDTGNCTKRHRHSKRGGGNYKKKVGDAKACPLCEDKRNVEGTKMGGDRRVFGSTKRRTGRRTRNVSSPKKRMRSPRKGEDMSPHLAHNKTEWGFIKRRSKNKRGVKTKKKMHGQPRVCEICKENRRLAAPQHSLRELEARRKSSWGLFPGVTRGKEKGGLEKVQ